MKGIFTFDENLIFLKQSFNRKEDAISFLAKELEKRGFVKESFLGAVLKREHEHPTGLELGMINVAIPHTETEHTKISSMAVLTLNSPVNFFKMDEPSVEIPVHIIFLLAIKDPNEYVRFLGKLTSQFANSGFIDKLYRSNNSNDVYEILELIFEGG